VQLSIGGHDDPAVAASKARALTAWEDLHAALADAVRLITPKELCFRLRITDTYLSEALRGKNSKGFRLEWLTTVVEMAPLDAVLPILRALAELRGCEVTKKKQRTPEEKYHAHRDAMMRLAPGVLALIDKEIGE
jgi:hypothetical protein